MASDQGRDEWARHREHPDILEEMPRSVASGRSMEEIAQGKGRKRVWHSNRSAKKDLEVATTRGNGGPPARSTARTPRRATASKQKAGSRDKKSAARAKPWAEGDVRFTHPDRVYWVDVGITKQDLAEYYRAVWDWMAPHVVNRPLSLVRCPDGTKGECFFQKHVSAGLTERNLRTVIDAKQRQVIAIEGQDGLLSLVQAGVLEVHVRGSMIDRLDICDRVVFDIDPGDGIGWSEVVAAARDVRERLAAIDLESFVKLSGGKGLHVVLPIDGSDWDTTKTFAQALAFAMASDRPERYVAKMTKSLRSGKIFIDYLRNSLEATSVAPYSTRARPGAPVSAPLTWEEVGRTKGGSQYTVLNLPKRLAGLKRDPWNADRAGQAAAAVASHIARAQARHSGKGMNSLSSPGTLSKRPSFQSALACSMRSLREETKFHQMWRGPSIAAPPSSVSRASLTAVTVIRSPGRKIRSRPAANRSPAISISPATR